MYWQLKYSYQLEVETPREQAIVGCKMPNCVLVQSLVFEDGYEQIRIGRRGLREEERRSQVAESFGFGEEELQRRSKGPTLA